VVTVDVCVVGAGLAGLTTALEICRHGLSVALVEAENVASGASGRNGGFVVSGFAEDLPLIARRIGFERARVLYDLSRGGVDYVREQTLALDPTIRMGDGYLSVQRFSDDGECRHYARSARDELGHDLEFWSRDEVREVLLTSRYHSAVFESDAFHIHPLNYALALAGEVERNGGRIFENSPGLRLDKSSRGVELTTPRGKVRAGRIVLCTGAGKGLLPALSRAILPVATHIVVSAAGTDIVDRSIRSSAAIADSRRAGDYYRIVDGGRLLWGGKITTRPSPPRHLPEIMKKTITGIYPQLDSIDIEYGWSGLMSYCLHKMPIIGELEPGVWAATGFGGHGLNTTAMAGCLIASAITEGDERWRRFSPYGPVWAGGPLGRLGVQLGYWWMQARDYRDERRSSS
jgi:glycine/D-amino acid oxidase-like deaminating enzyme